MTAAALLLSGGMDSVALAYWLRPAHAITVDYGQMAARGELEAASSVCRSLNIPHHVVRVDCRALGSGDMAGTAAHGAAPASDWWPYRNQLLITLTAMRAITLNVDTLMIGTVRGDAGHLDGTPGFVERLDALMRYQEGGLRVTAPAIAMSTAELIRTADVPLSLLAWAHSCHVSDIACGTCRGCNKHREVTGELDLDPY